MRYRVVLSALLLCGCAGYSQTTDGLVSGRLTDSQRGGPIAGANVFYSSFTTNASGAAHTDMAGYYSLPLLSPGIYRVRVEAQNYQAQELQELELPVASRLELDFTLRPLNDVWEAGQYRSVLLPGSRAIVTFYGPDLDESHSASVEGMRGRSGALETTVSQVVHPEEVERLPLAGRDVYTTLVLQPGVTADTGTGRGIGVAINGQRPTASNFLLDGVENNNYLVTGPLSAIPPEAMQEYRISLNNFSAEYGSTSGYIANAVTRAGGDGWHGLAYYYLKNEALNANDFQRNRNGYPRAKDRELQSGASFGGPLIRGKLFVALSGEYFQFNSQGDPSSYRLPTPQFYSLFHISPPATGLALAILRQFAPPPAPVSTSTGTAFATVQRPSSLDRVVWLPRLDYLLRGGAHRITARESVVAANRPDFIWTPYIEFITPLNQRTQGLAIADTNSFRPSLTNEARFGYNSDSLRFERRYPSVPSLVSFDPANNRIWLPGSPAFYGFRNDNHYVEAIDNLVWVHGRHLTKFGGSFLHRRLNGTMSIGPFFVFQNYTFFYFDQPTYFFAPGSRTDASALDTSFDRSYRYNQFAAFAQDSYRATARLTLDYGLRYERFGAPVNDGATKDLLVRLGSGTSLPGRIASASLVTPTGDEPLYDTDNKDFAARAGFSLALRANGNTVLRGSYGMFYDRPFDNLWLSQQANNFVLSAFNAGGVNYLQPLDQILPKLLSSPNQRVNVPSLSLYQPAFRNGYVQSFFLGLQQRVNSVFTVEVNGTGTLGRRLITTDVLNRPGVAPPRKLGTPGLLNGALSEISYLANQGLSDYYGLSAVARYRAGRLQFQAAYTWSHSIDNQSLPLTGNFFSFAFTGGQDDRGQPLAGTLLDSLLQGRTPNPTAAFAEQFNSRGDRGNSDFDQRQNLVGFGTYDLPPAFSGTRFAPLLRDWTIGALGALRTGFPYSVLALDQSSGLIFNNRANLIGDPYLNTPLAGGQRLLNAAAFSFPSATQVGNTGRNEFRGPGLASLDVSVSRSVALRWLGEGGRLTLRADFFNFLNHANLGNPDANFTSAEVAQRTFGAATYGRQDIRGGFPSVAPLDETSRQVQILVRISF